MNRYTYKAKRKDGTRYEGKWVFGYYHQLNEYGKIIDCIIEFNRGTSTPIDINTLSQCTGLQDIEGDYIFENDICCSMWGKHKEIGHIEFKDYEWKFKNGPLSVYSSTNIKIIGNKFDEVK